MESPPRVAEARAGMARVCPCPSRKERARPILPFGSTSHLPSGRGRPGATGWGFRNSVIRAATSLWNLPDSLREQFGLSGRCTICRRYNASNRRIIISWKGILMLGHRFLLPVFVISMTLAGPSVAQQGCARDSSGQVICAPPGGAAAVNSEGQVVSGRGECARDSYGQVICADTPGGGAAVGSDGKVVTGRGACARNSYGQVICAITPGGGAEVDNYGQVKTGPGQCVRNPYGQVMCSSEPYGGAAIDSDGQAVCAGQCVPGR